MYNACIYMYMHVSGSLGDFVSLSCLLARSQWLTNTSTLNNELCSMQLNASAISRALATEAYPTLLSLCLCYFKS